MSDVLIFGGGCCVGSGLMICLVIWIVIEAFFKNK